MTSLGLLAGVALDQVLPDPRRGHPVAIFGTAASRLERLMWRDDRKRGVAYTATLVGSAALIGIGTSRLTGLKLAAATAAGTWAVLGGRSLAAEASAIDDLLSQGDLAAARQRLTHLVGRRTQDLDEAQIARAVIESLAENSSDAVVAPLFWGALAGLPGLLAYRAVNTLDAMVGHRSPRYERFGWASARADDVANYVPARLTAFLTVALAPLAGGTGHAALAAWRADGSKHPSPNAGVCESAYAGALGLRLGGRNDYGSRVEYRPVLGAAGKPAARGDISRAVKLSRGVVVGAALACAGLAVIAAPMVAILGRGR
jgi:adenosylcobinamide-phosphate synthase